MKTQLIVVCLLLLAVPAFSGLIFTDDFESYNLGDDIAGSANWDNFDASSYGVLTVTNGFAGKGIWTDERHSPDPFTISIYECLKGGQMEDCAASVQCCSTSTSPTKVFLILRYNSSAPNFSEYYVELDLPSGVGQANLIMAYVDQGGSYTLGQKGISGFDPSSIHTLYFEVTGTNPIVMKVDLDGTNQININNTTYFSQSGLPMLAMANVNPDDVSFVCDNYNLYNLNVAVQPQSVGFLRALFH
jgi:hypothetical protein